MIDEIFTATIKKYGLLKKRDRLILGVSGGPDSLCLLHQFLKIQKDYKLYLVCVHFNHGLRKEADAEEEFVKQTCRFLKVPCLSEKKNVEAFFKGDSLEQTARNLRFDFFLKCSRQTKIKKIALAHHKDDLIETVLLRLLRGSGLRGLRGFLPEAQFKRLSVIRPLIEVGKEQILEWLEINKISYCVDASNFEDKFLRNRIRLEVLPLLKKLNPNIADTLANLAYAVSLDYDFIYKISYETFLSLKRGEGKNNVRLELKGLKTLHPALFNNVIRLAVEEVKGSTRRLELRHLDEVRDLVLNRPFASIVDLPQMTAKKEEKTLLIQSLIL